MFRESMQPLIIGLSNTLEIDQRDVIAVVRYARIKKTRESDLRVCVCVCVCVRQGKRVNVCSLV